jgi:multidrug efflux pump subunit AcrA (membrane-fusion protein)
MTSFSTSSLLSNNNKFHAHVLTRPPKLILLSSLLLVFILGMVITALITVQWRQTVIGQGQVTVFDPLQRPQAVQSQIKGRLLELLVSEGDQVEAGQVLARLEDRDSKFLDPRQTERLGAQIEALEKKKTAALARMQALRGQISAVQAAAQAKQAAAEAKVVQARQKVIVNRQLLAVANQNLETARLQEARVEKLETAGLKSRRDLELAVQKRVQEEAKLNKLRAELTLNEQEVNLARIQIAQIPAEAAEKVQKAEESLAKANEDIAEVEQKVQKLSNESGALHVRRSLQTVVAPCAGVVVNLKKLGLGQLLKEGETIARIVPQDQEFKESRGVELYLSGVDAPLVEVGVSVRLMFEGFPAVPFAGWDWAPVGTFGGVVSSVDPVDTEGEKSGFRVWVLPDPSEAAWPDQKRLRLGSKVSGWLQLNQVPLYYELWRQLNAFPARPSTSNGKKPKTKPVIRR